MLTSEGLIKARSVLKGAWNRRRAEKLATEESQRAD
jgi:hypothetical protein